MRQQGSVLVQFQSTLNPPVVNPYCAIGSKTIKLAYSYTEKGNTVEQQDINKYIDDLAVAVAQQQGVQFKSLKEAEEHTKRTTQQIHQLFEQNSLLIKEGLKVYSEQSTRFVADISSRLLANLENPAEINKILTTEIQGNTEALKLFSEAANSFYDCGDFHVEQCVLSVFLMLFPLFPQPYACYATLIWRKEGISAAETFYEQLVGAMEDPVLDYFAADCFVKAGNVKKAKELVQRALAKTQDSLHEHKDLREHLAAIYRRCQQAY